MAQPQRRVRRRQETELPRPSAILGMQSAVAVGYDPKSGTIHFMVKTGEEERRWTQQVSAGNMLALETIKGVLRGLGA